MASRPLFIDHVDGFQPAAQVATKPDHVFVPGRGDNELELRLHQIGSRLFLSAMTHLPEIGAIQAIVSKITQVAEQQDGRECRHDELSLRSFAQA
ncbi:hypothetical protein MY11210_002421 [Beauveria gryllotalpidicola]